MIYGNLKDYTNALRGLPIAEFQNDALRERLSKDDFHWVMFYLLQRIFQSPISDRPYQIIIPELELSREKQSAIFFSVLALQHEENQSSHIPVFARQSHWFLPRKNKDYVALGGNTFSPINSKSPDLNTRVELKDRDLQELIEWTDHAGVYDRATAKKRLLDYFEDFKNILPTNSACLTRFPKRTLLIADKAVTAKHPLTPFQYGDNDRSLPTEPAVQIVNSWEQAFKLLKKDTRYEQLIVLGSARYLPYATEIAESQTTFQHLRHVVLIGSEAATLPQSTNWQWTVEEVEALQNNPICAFEQMKLPADSLEAAFEEIKRYESKLSDEGVSLSALKRITQQVSNRLFRKTAVNADIDNILNEFGEEDMEKLDDLFKASGKSNNEAKVANVRLSALYLQATESLALDNPKATAIRAVAEENPKSHLVIVTDKKGREQLQTLLEKEGFPKAEVVTPSVFQQKLPAKYWDITKTTFIFPYIELRFKDPLQYYTLYKKACRANGRAILLHYGMEDKRIKMFEGLYDERNVVSISAADRATFTDIIFQSPIEKAPIPPVPTDANTESIAQYFSEFYDVYTDDLDDKKETETLSAAIKSEDIADTYSFARAPATRRVLFQEGGEILVNEQFIFVTSDKIKTDVDALKEGDKIVYYDINADKCRAALQEIPEGKALLKLIDQASRRWYVCLEGIHQYAKIKGWGAAVDIKKKLTLSVKAEQLEGWLKKSKSDLFPRSEDDLKKILDFYQRIKPNILPEEEAKEILALKQESTKLTEVSTKLNRELMLYYCDGTAKGLPILSKLTPGNIKMAMETQVSRTIKTVERL